MTLETLQIPNGFKPVEICGLTIYPPWNRFSVSEEEHMSRLRWLEDLVRLEIWDQEHPYEDLPKEPKESSPSKE